MPISLTADNYLALTKELERQRADLIKWKSIASIADEQTPDDSVTPEQYTAACGFHLDKQLPNYAFCNYTDLAEISFAMALVSIELAPPAAQSDALNTLLPLVENIVINKDENLEEDQIYFYTAMLNHLGPRLAPSNQAVVLEWMINNAFTSSNGDIREFTTTHNFDPDDCAGAYADDVKANVGEKLLGHLNNEQNTLGYADNVVAWFTRFIGNKDPRCIAAFNIPNEPGYTTYQEAWVVPSKAGQDKVLLVKPDHVKSSGDIPHLLSIFKTSVDAESTAEYVASINNIVSVLSDTFFSHAMYAEKESSKQMAMIRALADLREFTL